MALTLKELAARIGAELTGDPNLPITSAATLEEAQAGQVTFLSNAKYARQIETTNASAVIVAPSVTTNHVALLRAKDPYYAFAMAVTCLHGLRQHMHSGVDSRAFIHPTATVGEGLIAYPGAYVGPRVRMGRLLEQPRRNASS